jgi:hypothetical protein
VIGVRPCDAKALALVKMNFDTPEYKDPYWLNLYNATTSWDWLAMRRAAPVLHHRRLRPFP